VAVAGNWLSPETSERPDPVSRHLAGMVIARSDPLKPAVTY
jgi:hypothetical protein